MAALCVVAYHTPDLWSWSLPHGGLAVDLFFAISGFIIAQAYEGKLRAGLGAGEFMALRLVRLYPLYALGSVVGAGVTGLFVALGAYGWTFDLLMASAIPAVVLLPALMRTPTPAAYPLNAPAWSLGLEIAINAAYALTWRWWTTRALLVALAVSAAGLVGATLHFGELTTGATRDTLAGGVPRVCFAFVAGLLIFRLRLAIGVRAPPVLIFAAVPLLLAAPAEWGLAYQLLCALVLLPGLVLLAVQVEPAAGAGACRFLGRVSYGVYALHAPLYPLFAWKAVGLAPAAAQPMMGVAFVVGLVGLCAVIDRIYDEPVRKVLSRRLAGPPRRSSPEGGGRVRAG